MILTLTIIHVVISVLLIVVVLMQHGKQQGMSGAIAGGAETFFGKNKGRTIDAMLRKFTAVIAILFVVSSLALTGLSVSEYKQSSETTEVSETSEATGAVTTDENGNVVDENGNVVVSADQLEQSEAPAEETPAE